MMVLKGFIDSKFVTILDGDSALSGGLLFLQAHGLALLGGRDFGCSRWS